MCFTCIYKASVPNDNRIIYYYNTNITFDSSHFNKKEDGHIHQVTENISFPQAS